MRDTTQPKPIPPLPGDDDLVYPGSTDTTTWGMIFGRQKKVPIIEIENKNIFIAGSLVDEDTLYPPE